MAITDLDEQLLVRAHQAGDEHAFGQIVRSQHRALYAHAYRRLGSHEAAEDAVQDTLLRAYRALPSFDGDLRLRAWLHRILTNVCHDESNRRRRQSGLIEKLEAQPVELAPDPIEEAVLHDTVRVMNEALAELPDTYREALVLRYVDGLSFKEVGDLTGISEENARARVHRGRQALNKILSRIAVMLAFIIPGLRSRAEKALDADVNALSSAGAAEPAITLSTRLASHMSTSAPMLERVATEGSTFVAAKSSVVATAVAAVAAVSAPVVAYQVYDTTKTPTAPPAAVAEPAAEEPTPGSTSSTAVTPIDPSPVDGVAGDDGVAGPPVADGSTTTSLVPSAANPFPEVEPDESTTTSTTTSTTVQPKPTVPTIVGSITSDTLETTGEGPNYDVAGDMRLSDDRTGTLTGRITVHDDGSIVAELALLVDGVEHAFRLRGVTNPDDAAQFTGKFTLDGGSALGLPERGDVINGRFERSGGGRSSLLLELEGEAQSS